MINTTCPKCGCEEAKLRYFTRLVLREEGEDNEWLIVTCTRCQYEHRVPTLDAKERSEKWENFLP